MQWLPALPSGELQLFLAQRLRWLCDSCAASRAACVRAGLVGSLLETLNVGSALGPQCQEQLLALLQALGRVSLRPLELRRLLRPPPGLDSDRAEAERARHAGAVIRALSGMARHQEPARSLHYFDLTPSMAGIMVPPVQRWPGPGFTFHAWLCLHPTDPAPVPAPARPLQRKQLYRWVTPGTGDPLPGRAGGGGRNQLACPQLLHQQWLRVRGLLHCGGDPGGCCMHAEGVSEHEPAGSVLRQLCLGEASPALPTTFVASQCAHACVERFRLSSPRFTLMLWLLF